MSIVINISQTKDILNVVNTSKLVKGNTFFYFSFNKKDEYFFDNWWLAAPSSERTATALLKHYNGLILNGTNQSHNHTRCFSFHIRVDRARWIVALREHKEPDVSTPTAGRFMCVVYRRSRSQISTVIWKPDDMSHPQVIVNTNRRIGKHCSYCGIQSFYSHFLPLSPVNYFVFIDLFIDLVTTKTLIVTVFTCITL